MSSYTLSRSKTSDGKFEAEMYWSIAPTPQLIEVRVYGWPSHNVLSIKSDELEQLIALLRRVNGDKLVQERIRERHEAKTT